MNQFVLNLQDLKDEYLFRIAKAFNKDLPECNILVMGLNKSGTTILTYRIAKGLFNAKIHFEPNDIVGQNDVELHDQITQRMNQVTKCIYYPMYPRQIKTIGTKYDKCVWICRDPRDTLLSAFFYYWFQRGKYSKERFDKFHTRVELKEKSPHEYAFVDMIKWLYNVEKHIKSTFAPLCKTVSSLSDNWYVLKYKDLMDENVDDLNSFLGFSIDKKAAINPKVKRVGRSFSYDNWRNWFTEKDVKVLKPLMTDILDDLGFDSADWKLNKDPVLDPAQGSAYMLKLYQGNGDN